MKRWRMTVLILVLLLAPVMAVKADNQPMENNRICVKIKGIKKQFRQPPVTWNDRTLIPLRELLVALDVPDDDQHILWNGAAERVDIVSGDTRVSLTVGQKLASVNGKSQTLDVPPVLYKDRVFLPARFVAEAMGYQVKWDESTETVSIVKPGQDDRPVIDVSDVNEFAAALGSDRIIRMKAGDYNLDAITTWPVTPGISWNDGKSKGIGLTMTNIHHLTIEGVSSAQTRLMTPYPLVNVLWAEESSDIELRNLFVGHSAGARGCSAGVLLLSGCEDIRIEGCELYGCGTVGINAYRVRGLVSRNTLINHCTMAGVTLYDCPDAVFEGLSMTDSRGNTAIAMINSQADFTNCIFKGNLHKQFLFMHLRSGIRMQACTIQGHKGSEELPLLSVSEQDDNKITLTRCTLSDNTALKLSDDAGMTQTQCVEKNNSWNLRPSREAEAILNDGTGGYNSSHPLTAIGELLRKKSEAEGEGALTQAEKTFSVVYQFSCNADQLGFRKAMEKADATALEGSLNDMGLFDLSALIRAVRSQSPGTEEAWDTWTGMYSKVCEWTDSALLSWVWNHLSEF